MVSLTNGVGLNAELLAEQIADGASIAENLAAAADGDVFALY